MILRVCFLVFFSVSLGKVFSEIDTSNISVDQKIGQLFVLPACSLRGEEHFEDLKYCIEQYAIGGIILMDGTVLSQRACIHRVRSFSSPVPLLCVQDGETGVGMRLIDVPSFPKNLTLGAVADQSLLYLLGKEIGKGCAAVGINLNFAPVVDVNTNPSNPIIHMRSFGENPQQVAQAARQVMEGIQSVGVLACAKHFPGHGDTAQDSHVTLPCALSTPLLPFQVLINAGVGAVMTAHIRVPYLEKDVNLPATFSYQVVTELLQGQLGFKGLVVTDALNMRALTDRYAPEEIAVKAFLAGHDILLYGSHLAANVDQILKEDVPRAIAGIKAAIGRGEITEEMLNKRVEKILKVKASLGLFKNEKEPFLEEQVFSEEAHLLQERLFDQAVKVIYQDSTVPMNTSNMLFLKWGEVPTFEQLVHKRFDCPIYTLTDSEWIERLKYRPLVILALAGLSTYPPDFALTAQVHSLLFMLAQSKASVVAVVFGTPYSVQQLPRFSGLVLGYEKAEEAQRVSADRVFQIISPEGN